MPAVDASARLDVAQPPEDVYRYLADLENHWELGDRGIRLASLDHEAGVARIHLRGPLGWRRTVRAHVDEQAPPTLLTGVATAGFGTRARVRWELVPSGVGTQVTLLAEVERATTGDRVLLALGGRRWLRRRLRGALRALQVGLAAS